MEKGQFITVSEWMANGNIMEYIKHNHVNRLELVRDPASPPASLTKTRQQLHGAAQGLQYLHGASLTHGDLKGVGVSAFYKWIVSEIPQANVLMSNDTPPRACLADFGFMTMVLDPGRQLACSAQLEGGTMAFMSPELLVPSRFGIQDSVPTPQADIYAFGLVMFQVCEQDREYGSFAYIAQVLTGQFPFRGVRQTKLGWSVVRGVRPTKPENASSIGFSDLLWSFSQRCWDDNMTLRPKVGEVVKRLEKEATDWDGLMPPCPPANNVTSDSEGQMSDTLEQCGFAIMILP